MDDLNTNIENDFSITSQKDLKDIFLLSISHYNPNVILERDGTFIYAIKYNQKNYVISIDSKSNNFMKIDFPISFSSKKTDEEILTSMNRVNRLVKSSKIILLNNNSKIERVNSVITVEYFIFGDITHKSITDYFEKSISLINTAFSSFFEDMKNETI
ncbi:MAG: hypothetical protein ABF641_13055 [Acetobacter sp.]